jgi:hypothetical protein
MIRIRRIASLGAALSLASCSVVRAATSDPGADVSVLSVGTTRAKVESALGPSVHAWSNDSGTAFRTYRCDAGREGSALDVFAFGMMDVATMGLWELIVLLDPKPMAIRRLDRRVVVSYGADDAVLGTFEEFAVLPKDGRVPPGGKPWTPVPSR